MQVSDIVLKDWHVVGLLATMLVAIFKQQIQDTLNSDVVIAEIKFHVGQSVEILTPDGRWESVMVKHYVTSIPFFRTGGIVIEHGADEGKRYREKISFTNYRATRVRAAIRE